MPNSFYMQYLYLTEFVFRHLKSKAWESSSSSPSILIHAKYTKIQTDHDDFDRLIKYFIYLANKLINHGHQKEICDLLYLINLNGFYTNT
jgi:hypothetical protein